MELVAAHGPYDARRMLWFLGLHATPGIERYDASPDRVVWARVLHLPGGPGVVRVVCRRDDAGSAAREVAGRDAEYVAEYDAELDLLDPADEAEAVARLGHLLDLAGDPGPALDALSSDPVLAPLVAARPGLRVPGTLDPFGTLISTIVGQQISLAGARTVLGRVVTAYGEPLPEHLARPGLTHAFPTPAALAAADPESLPMPRARGRSVVAVAQAVVDQGPDLASGAAPSRDALLALPGIGPWTASYLSLRAARDPDVFLPTDLAVRRALERRGRPGDPVSAATSSAAWAPHRSVALMHLWVDLLESRGAQP